MRRSLYLIPPFFLGKLASDTAMLFMGKYSYNNAQAIAHGMLSWQSLLGVFIGVLLLAALLFVDWRTALEKHQLRFKLKIWKRH